MPEPLAVTSFALDVRFSTLAPLRTLTLEDAALRSNWMLLTVPETFTVVEDASLMIEPARASLPTVIVEEFALLLSCTTPALVEPSSEIVLPLPLTWRSPSIVAWLAVRRTRLPCSLMVPLTFVWSSFTVPPVLLCVISMLVGLPFRVTVPSVLTIVRPVAVYVPGDRKSVV